MTSAQLIDMKSIKYQIIYHNKISATAGLNLVWFRPVPFTSLFGFRVRAKITSQNWRSDLVQVWLIRESKTTGIASYFADFASEVSAKDGLKLKCKNVKLFLREPLV
jgi:hypothetical protein